MYDKYNRLKPVLYSFNIWLKFVLVVVSILSSNYLGIKLLLISKPRKSKNATQNEFFKNVENFLW